MSNHPLIADRDCRSLREKFRELEEGQTVRVVSESPDVLARVKEDAFERKMDGHHIVEVLIKVYGDSRVEHEVAALSWWKPGPVMFGCEDLERVKRLEVK